MGKKKRMAFYEIDRGMLAVRVQEDFERAQKLVLERGNPAKIKMEIVIKPPDPESPEYTPLSYAHQLIEPAIKSPEIAVINKDGVLMRDAQEPLEQLKLDLK